MYEVFQSEKSGKFYFRLKATNGQVILASEAYEKKSGAENGVASVQKNGQKEERFERKLGRVRGLYFVLRAGNGQAIGKSESYASEAGMEKGIASVMRNCVSQTVNDLT